MAIPADPMQPPQPFAGTRDSLTQAVVATINADGSVDTRSMVGRGGKAGVLVPSWYIPAVDDRVLVGDLDGNDQRPVVVQCLYPAAGTTIAPTGRLAAPRARVAHSADQTVGATSSGILAFDTEYWDRPASASHSVTVNPSRLTVPLTGGYAVGVDVRGTYVANQTIVNDVLLLENGAELARVSMVFGATKVCSVSFSSDAEANAGDYFEIQVVNNGPATLTVPRLDYSSPQFFFHYIGPK